MAPMPLRGVDGRRRGARAAGIVVAAWLALVLSVACAPAPRSGDAVPWPDLLPEPVGAWVCPDEPLAPAYAPTLFVATDGSDLHDGRSPERPLRSLQRAADLVRPGDVVWLRGGTYPSAVVFSRSGSAEAPIVVESAPGECAVLSGAGLEGDARVQIWNVRHMILRNLVVRDVGAEGIYLRDVRDSTVAHVRSHGHGGSGVLSMGGQRNLFAYLVLHDNFDPPHGGNADGISVSSGDANRVTHCLAYRNSDDGVDTWLSTRSLVERCVSAANGWQGGDGNGFKLGGANRRVGTIVRESLAYGNRFDGFDTNSGTGIVIERNTAFGNGRFGFVAGPEDDLLGNLAFGNAAGPWRREGSAPAAWEGGGVVRGTAAGSADPADARFATLLDEAVRVVGQWASGDLIGPAGPGAVGSEAGFDDVFGPGLRPLLDGIPPPG
jgi:hypothetical protein